MFTKVAVLVAVLVMVVDGVLTQNQAEGRVFRNKLVNIKKDKGTCPVNYEEPEIVEYFQTIDAFMNLGLRPTTPASSCADLPYVFPSGYYWIQGKQDGLIIKMYCDTNRTCSCNGTGRWMRVANLDMTDPNQQCPSGFRYVTSPRRSCGRIGHGCVSTTFPVHGVEYSRVCGKVIGYQERSPDAFQPYSFNQALTIDDAYFEGASLTHGSSPRVHIWTFLGVFAEQFGSFGPGGSVYACPCINQDIPFEANGGRVPPFIGQDYFCESGNRGTITGAFITDDPLWDGQGCGAVSHTCCDHPLYFCKQLPQPTRDDIELRLCGERLSDEDTPIEMLEIYVQ